MSGLWRLTVSGQFSAAHALRNYCGKCENNHGHNFEVEVCVEGSQLDQKTGMLLDFGVLKQALRQILANLDHRLLNETQPFDQINPSSELLARHIWKEMASQLAISPDPQAALVKLVTVSVSEKPGQKATWLGA